jgi:diamine N-acetyltransferase
MLKGDKIYLRALEPADINFLYHCENDTSVWNVTNTFIPFSKNNLLKYINSQQDIYADKQLRLVIINKQDNQPVGFIDIFDFDPYHMRAGIGILVAGKENRNKGYAREALQIISVYTKNILGLKNLFCNILANNMASIKIFEANNFKKIACKPAWHRQNNEWIDEYFYIKTLTHD